MERSVKSCKWCQQPIPTTKKQSAQYCSEICYYEAKKERSIEQYRRLKQPSGEIKRNEQILAGLYPLANSAKTIKYEDMEAYKFNWGISTGETFYDGKVCRIINAYAYYLCPKTKIVSIWRLKQSQ